MHGEDGVKGGGGARACWNSAFEIGESARPQGKRVLEEISQE